MNIKDYVTYEDVNISSLFDILSKQLKIVHNNNYVVNNLNCDGIYVNDNMSFKNIRPASNYEKEKRENIIALSKIMIGTVLSKGTTFRDFSSVDNDWFTNNFDSIFSVINEEDFDKDYFYSVFFEGQNMYYSDYLNEKKKKEELSGRENVNSYRKVLRTAASSLYEDLSDDNTNVQEKSALISTSFNPILLISISAVIFLIITIFILLIN